VINRTDHLTRNILYRISVCPSVFDVDVWWSHWLEYFENNFIA